MKSSLNVAPVGKWTLKLMRQVLGDYHVIRLTRSQICCHALHSFADLLQAMDDS
jgi:hypothetical protein